MIINTLTIQASTPYPIYFTKKLLQSDVLARFCRLLNKRLVIITDTHLVNSHGKNVLAAFQRANITVELLVFPAGETHKTRATKQQLEDQLLEKEYGRDTCLIALGGGVVTDIVGFLAATYCRGIPVIYLPTTLLAMVDACIGGKTGVNTPQGKNLIGCFSQPLAVFIDTDMLNGLPEREWKNGIAEMLKHGMIADKNIFSALKNNVKKMKYESDFLATQIYASCLIKKNIVEQDEKEQGIRHILNFGHTIGHALETIENYRISHGEAVAIGMLIESYLSMQKGYLSKAACDELLHALRLYELPLNTSACSNTAVFLKQLTYDKKSIAQIAHFVLLDEIGKPHQQNGRYTQAVDFSLLTDALDWYLTC